LEQPQFKEIYHQAEGRANRTKGSREHEGGKGLRNLALCVPLCALVVKYSSFIFNFFIHLLNRDLILTSPSTQTDTNGIEKPSDIKLLFHSGHTEN
jgi:hypothetical protein